jgi:hypothetical protein
MPTESGFLWHEHFKHVPKRLLCVCTSTRQMPGLGNQVEGGVVSWIWVPALLLQHGGNKKTIV